MKPTNLVILLIAVCFSANIIGVISGMYLQKNYVWQKRGCTGYSKIAYGLAIDCYGDTVIINEYYLKKGLPSNPRYFDYGKKAK